MRTPQLSFPASPLMQSSAARLRALKEKQIAQVILLGLLVSTIFSELFQSYVSREISPIGSSSLTFHFRLLSFRLPKAVANVIAPKTPDLYIYCIANFKSVGL
mmetsp:Transcript_36855/g.68295  ORF Transcript_36855/g.68295 Transcript_36855/m.68295 type:complete len:103 (+) Transcript_36855:92-400(+)